MKHPWPDWRDDIAFFGLIVWCAVEDGRRDGVKVGVKSFCKDIRAWCRED